MINIDSSSSRNRSRCDELARTFSSIRTFFSTGWSGLFGLLLDLFILAWTFGLLFWNFYWPTLGGLLPILNSGPSLSIGWDGGLLPSRCLPFPTIRIAGLLNDGHATKNYTGVPVCVVKNVEGLFWILVSTWTWNSHFSWTFSPAYFPGLSIPMDTALVIWTASFPPSFFPLSRLSRLRTFLRSQ